MKQFGIFSCVRGTSVPGYSNEATSGVDATTYDIMGELDPIFRDNVEALTPNATRNEIISAIEDVANKLDDDGFCLFYFHGHGDSVLGDTGGDELKDQVLVCSDTILKDDEITSTLRLFKNTQRILTIVDSCSSETVIEWPGKQLSDFPQILHLASSHDGDEAGALPQGGDFSNKLLNVISNGGFFNLSYRSFIYDLELSSINTPFYYRHTENFNLEIDLFT
ncbi:MAG: caspase family protein [Bacteroidota bacterium]